jgi:hypothetical protein
MLWRRVVLSETTRRRIPSRSQERHRKISIFARRIKTLHFTPRMSSTHKDKLSWGRALRERLSRHQKLQYTTPLHLHSFVLMHTMIYVTRKKCSHSLRSAKFIIHSFHTGTHTLMTRRSHWRGRGEEWREMLLNWLVNQFRYSYDESKFKRAS